MKVDFNHIACVLMFRGGDDFKQYLTDHKIQYRKNKSLSDVANAIKKSKRNGMYKTEYELGMLELYLKDVFKVNKGE